MKAKDVIKHMQDYHPDDEIIILWWDSDTVADQVVSNEEWNTIVSNFDDYSFGDLSYVANRIRLDVDDMKRKKWMKRHGGIL
jgi:hypothetical protein